MLTNNDFTIISQSPYPEHPEAPWTADLQILLTKTRLAILVDYTDQC